MVHRGALEIHIRSVKINGKTFHGNQTSRPSKQNRSGVDGGCKLCRGDPLKPERGDLIVYLVTPKSAWSSKLIAIGQLILGRDRGVKQASHWAIYAGSGKQYEAVWPRVRKSSIYKRPYEIWRRKGITQKQRNQIIASAVKRLGEHYGILYVLSFGLIKQSKDPVCCVFGQDCYMDAGLFVKGNTPDDIYDDKKMIKVYQNYR